VKYSYCASLYKSFLEGRYSFSSLKILRMKNILFEVEGMIVILKERRFYGCCNFSGLSSRD
jgi:hypothetical protein